MEQIQTNTVMVMAMVAQHLQLWLRKVLMWLIDEEGERTVKNIGKLSKQCTLRFASFMACFITDPNFLG